MLSPTQVLEFCRQTTTAQSESLRTYTMPREFCPTILTQVVSDTHILPEISHGTFHPKTWFIESDHNKTITHRH